MPVSRYYSTIYTHTIPWALHSKVRAKVDRSDKLCGNVIDKCVRNTQDKQTLGIPTGPDTSLIISEIIGTAMDIRLSNELKDIKLNGYRYIDDYYLFFSNWAQAEQATSKIHSTAKHFELVTIQLYRIARMMLTLIITVCRSTTCTKIKNDIQCRGYLKLAFWNWPHEISKSGSDDAVCGGLNSYRKIKIYPRGFGPSRISIPGILSSLRHQYRVILR